MADTLKSKYILEDTQNSTEAISDTVGSSEVDTVLSISICNTTTDNTTFNLRLNPDSGNTTDIYLNQSLPAESTFIHNSKIVLIEDDVLEFQTTEAVLCNIVTSYLHQTAVSTSADYLDRFIHRAVNNSGSSMIVDGSAHSKTILAFTVCNRHATTDAEFGINIRTLDNTVYIIYKNQSIPAQSTFEHSDKIMLGNNEELVFIGSNAVNLDVVTSYLRQP